MEDVQVGNIITKDFEDFPVYGIVLPKNRFIYLFKTEKGQWPTWEDVTEEITKKFGAYLPKQGGKIAPSQKFMEDDSLIGAKMFGNFYNKYYKRTLGFEIFSKRNLSGNFKPQNLPLILNIKNKDMHEFGAPPSIIPNSYYELEFLRQYYVGLHKGKPSFGDHLSQGQMKLIDLLRDCEIPEEII